MANAAIVTYLDAIKIVDPNVLPDPSVGADREFPRKFHPHAWFDPHPLADFGSEKTQQKPAMEAPREPRGDK